MCGGKPVLDSLFGQMTFVFELQHQEAFRLGASAWTSLERPTRYGVHRGMGHTAFTGYLDAPGYA